MHSVSDVSALFQAAVSHGLGTNPSAVRVFRRRCKLLWKLLCSKRIVLQDGSNISHFFSLRTSDVEDVSVAVYYACYNGTKSNLYVTISSQVQVTSLLIGLRVYHKHPNRFPRMYAKHL